MLIKSNKGKIFCIGAGKTGTTSTERALRDLGYRLGNQVKAELLLDHYVRRDFRTIARFCRRAEAFQDAPFCFKYTFIALDQAYPGSKFILTVRDNAEQWYNSLVSYHTKLYSSTDSAPTVEDLKNADYRYKGYAWDVRNKVFGIGELDDPYDKQVHIDYYNDHNSMVLDYFRHRRDLLVINVAEQDSYRRFCDFLGRKPLYDEFPWENRTKDFHV
jgi:hypothetical protein